MSRDLKIITCKKKQCFGSGSGLDPASNGLPGSGSVSVLEIRIHAGHNCPRKMKNKIKFVFEEFPIGLEASSEA
jgi:hypothetical protein